MKIRIISDGIPANTQIVNAETGERIEGIVSASWQISANSDTAKVTLIFKGQIGIDLVGEWDETTPDRTVRGG